jgi:hypothetical protein
VYHTRVPNSTFIAKMFDEDKKIIVGQVEVLEFRGDTLVVTNPNHIAQLDAIADTPGCPIYTKSAQSAMMGENMPFSEVKNRAAEVAEQLAKSGQRV